MATSYFIDQQDIGSFSADRPDLTAETRSGGGAC